MRILGCIVKSVTTFVALAVIVLLLSVALPDSRGAIRFLGTLVIVFALAWVTLTIWWFMRLRPPRRGPAREPRSIEMPVPRWVRILVAVLCVPVMLGVAAVADELNNRPRQTLGWLKPTEVLNKFSGRSWWVHPQHDIKVLLTFLIGYETTSTQLVIKCFDGVSVRPRLQ